MPDDPASPALSPTGEVAAPDHVGVAFRSICFGVLFGLSVTSALLWVVRTAQLSSPPVEGTPPSGTIVNLLLLAWLGGGALATASAFSLMRPLTSLYRRGGLAMVAGFATLVVTFVTQPVDALFGRAGLLGLAAVATGLCLLLGRSIARKRD
jgi:hypothetical protein